jgi:hypothetical protein
VKLFSVAVENIDFVAGLEAQNIAQVTRLI